MRCDVVLASDVSPRSQADVWVYLGKDTKRRDSVAERLGEEKRLRLAQRVGRIAGDTRDEFVSWVAEIGYRQPRQLTWWATRLSSPSPHLTDAHLLLCYMVLFDDILTDYEAQGELRLIIAVEDPWLYLALRRQHGLRVGVRFPSPVRWHLLRTRLAWLSHGVVARLYLLLLVLYQRAIFRRVLKRHQSKGVFGLSEPKAWIYNHPEPRLFVAQQGLSDPYTPGLQEMLESEGITTGRVLGLPVPRQLLQAAATRVAQLLPLVSLVRFIDIVRAVSRFTAIKGPVPNGPGGLDLSVLVERDKWLEVRGLALSRTLLEYYAFLEFFQTHSGSVLYYYYENHPWERMLCLAREHSGSSMTLVGYQHSTVPLLLLNYFPHPGQWASMPHPNRVLASGSIFKKTMEEKGYPRGLVVEGGALRFPGIERRKTRRLSNGESVNVYVALSTDASLDRELLALLLQHDDTWAQQSIRFMLKPHPDTPFEYIGLYPEQGGQLKSTDKALGDLFDSIDVVLYSGTTVGLEALFQGFPTVAYVPDGVISPDVVLDLFSESVFVADSETLVEQVLAAARGEPRAPLPLEPEEIFGPVDKSAWIRPLPLST